MPSTVGPALERDLRGRFAPLDLSALSRASSSSRSRRFVLSWRLRSPPRLQVFLQHPGRREVIHASGPLLPPTSPGAGDGQAGGETLVPLHEPYVRQLFFQGVQSIQNLARLKANLPAERLRDADQDLGYALLVYEPPERLGEVFAGHDLEGAGDDPGGIGDGYAGTNLSQVEGSDTPAGVCGGRQELLLVASEPLAQDLTHPGQGFRYGFEVPATRLGHGRPAASSTAENVGDLPDYVARLDLLGDFGVQVCDQDGLAVERRGEDHGRRPPEPVLDVVGDLAETLDVGRDDLAGDDLGPVHRLGVLDQVVHLAKALPERLLACGLARRPDLVAQLGHGLGETIEVHP